MNEQSIQSASCIKNGFALFLCVAMCVAFSFAAFLAGESQRLNEYTHCHADGAPCVFSCDPADPLGFTPVSEDDPCWLIVSADSSYVVPSELVLFGARDYR